MFFLSSFRARLSLLLILVPSASFLLYQRYTYTDLRHALPQDVLNDYTSPSIHCFWSESSGSDDHVASTSTGTKGRLEEWLGWSSSNSQYEGKKSNEETLDGFIWEGQLPDVIPSSGIEKYMLSHIEELQIGYDPKHDHEEYGLRLGNISLSEYTKELLTTYKEYLLPQTLKTTSTSNSKLHLGSYISPVLSRLSLRPPIKNLPERPKQVMTTDKSIDDLPWQFNRWKEIMPDWEIKYFDDDSLSIWVNDIFPQSKAQRIWKDLPRQVLKTDIFRYMAMLVEGGIYTDR
ncbi:uncharacterized protein IL334_003301 [Kwoniella shivajii]|uniref:Uncharacterized protein n=1 Tax=Kwoniella shivajii TaxID=564305 RepID=A0ABZ1CXJ0_9TREE|nr:hypothetical protein IL334_003301 [Kwoniella shivajii]